MRTQMLRIICTVMLISSCIQDTTADKSKLPGNDYRLFQETPAWNLAKAVKDSDDEKIKSEIQKNKNLLAFREPRFGQSILQLAVENTNFKSTEMLLKLGANPNMQDLYRGESPTMAAANIGISGAAADSRFLKLLLKSGGDPNAAEKPGEHSLGYTPLIIACKNGNREYVKILLAAGANVNFITRDSTTALKAAVIAATISDNPDIAVYLIQKGADFKPPLLTRADGEKYYITNAMREWRFDLGSDAYKKKMWLADFLKKNGMDYRATKVPDEFKGDYSKEYLEKY